MIIVIKILGSLFFKIAEDFGLRKFYSRLDKKRPVNFVAVLFSESFVVEFVRAYPDSAVLICLRKLEILATEPDSSCVKYAQGVLIK